MASLIELVDHFESICGISMEKHLLATPGDATVKAAFRTFDIAVPGEEWAAIKEEVEKNAQSVFDDCERMIFDGLPLKDSEPNTTRQVFIAAISAVLINSKGKGGVPKSLNDLLVEIHKSTKDLSSLPAPEGQLDLVIGQLFRRIIKVIGYAQPKPSSRFSLSSPTECDVVKRTAVQEELHHIRWLVDDLQWGFGDFSTVFELKTPPSSSTEKRSWSRSDFFCQTKERIQELRGSPQGEGEEKRFQTALGRLVEVMDGLVTRLPDFEEKIIGDTYDEVVRLLQATKATNSSLEMVSNVLTEVSRCLSGFITSINTPKNKVALARSIVVTLSILQTLPDAIQNHAAHLTVVSAISKISVLNIEQKLNLFHEEIAQLVGDLRSLTAILDGGENVKGPAFAFMWDEASKKNKSLTSTNIGALSDTLLKPHSLLTTPVEAHTRAGTADPCEYSTIQNLLSIHANIETVDDLRLALVGHIDDLCSALNDLLPPDVRNTLFYEQNIYTRTAELTRHLDIHGKNSMLMERFLEWLQNRGWIPKSAWSIVGNLLSKASSTFGEALNFASKLAGGASTAIGGIYEPDNDKYPPLPSPFSARLESWTGICINGAVTLQYTIIPIHVSPVALLELIGRVFAIVFSCDELVASAHS